MTEVERITQRILGVQAEQTLAEQQWQRCAGALSVLRYMLGEAQRDADEAGKIQVVEERMNGELPRQAGEHAEQD